MSSANMSAPSEKKKKLSEYCDRIMEAAFSLDHVYQDMSKDGMTAEADKVRLLVGVVARTYDILVYRTILASVEEMEL